MSEIKTYAFSIRTDEIFLAIGTKKAEALLTILKNVNCFVGIWQEPHGLYQTFMFSEPEGRDMAQALAQEYGFETVDERDLQ